VVIKDTFATRNIFGKGKALTNAELIFSMWDGYLRDVKSFWDNHKVKIVGIHSSGHAYIEELKSFVNAVKPKYIIPNHTFFPEKYRDILGGNIMLVRDKQSIIL
jgi:ribonuclease J